jgi:hypothetical protein
MKKEKLAIQNEMVRLSNKRFLRQNTVENLLPAGMKKPPKTSKSLAYSKAMSQAHLSSFFPKRQTTSQNLAANGSSDLRLARSRQQILKTVEPASHERGQRVMSGLSRLSRSGKSIPSGKSATMERLHSAHAGGKKDSIVSAQQSSLQIGPHQGGFTNSQQLETIGLSQQLRQLSTHEIREIEHSQDESSYREQINDPIDGAGADSRNAPKQDLNKSTSFKEFMLRQKDGRMSQDSYSKLLKTRLLHDESIQQIALRNELGRNKKLRPQNQTFSHWPKFGVSQRLVHRKKEYVFKNPKASTKALGLDFLDVKREIAEELRKVSKRTKKRIGGNNVSQTIESFRSRSNSPLTQKQDFTGLFCRQPESGMSKTLSKADLHKYMKKKQKRVKQLMSQQSREKMVKQVQVAENLNRLETFIRGN